MVALVKVREVLPRMYRFNIGTATVKYCSYETKTGKTTRNIRKKRGGREEEG